MNGIRPEHDFTQTLPQWEASVFDAATMFVVSRWDGQWLRDEFADFAEAVTFARSWQGPHGRPAVVVAVAPSGRHLTMGSRSWSEWLRRWESRH
jgi:hypothetical protein